MPSPRRKFDGAYAAHRAVSAEELPVDDIEQFRMDEALSPSPEMTKYIFDLQGRVEKGARVTEAGAEKGMDYHEYAKIFWQEQAPAEMRENAQAQQVFERMLIHDLQHIPMNELVYSDITPVLGGLMKEYGSDITRVGIWSTGDVDATGYQVSKIMRSNILGSFRRGLREAVTTPDERMDFVRNKTEYIVDNDKFQRLAEYVQRHIGQQPAGEKMKIVIVEDSAGNFDKAKKALDAAGFEGQFEIVPIWAVYSREGIKAAKEPGYEEKRAKNNAIDSFADLKDAERFKPLLAGGHLFVDFDGVIGNNVTMRKYQADATYGAFLAGMNAAGPTEKSTEA